MSSTAQHANLEWCHDTVQGVSRTFALTVDVLEEPMASEICLGYLLCRVADTVEDASHIPPDAQVELLERYRAALDPDRSVTVSQFRDDVDRWLPPEVERTDDWTLVANAPTVWETFATRAEAVRSAILPPVLEMVGGMATFVERYAADGGLRIGSPSELERYCHYAAGTVGTLTTNLVTLDGVPEETARRLYDTANSFGLFLQLVNVSKDVYADYTDENNVYLPADWLAAEGVAQDALVDPAHRDSVGTVVKRTAARAESYFDDAQTYLETMPLARGNTLAAWLIPYLLGLGTLREVNNRPTDALTETGIKVSRDEVFAVIEAARNADRSRLDELRERIGRGPLHLEHES